MFLDQIPTSSLCANHLRTATPATTVYNVPNPNNGPTKTQCYIPITQSPTARSSAGVVPKDPASFPLIAVSTPRGFRIVAHASSSRPLRFFCPTPLLCGGDNLFPRRELFGTNLLIYCETCQWHPGHRYWRCFLRTRPAREKLFSARR